MGQNPEKIGHTYDGLALKYAETFLNDHKNKPKDREMLARFARMIGAVKPVWDMGCGPGQTARYLKDLGLEVFTGCF